MGNPPSRAAPSDITRAEIIVVSLLSVVIAIVMSWPLALHTTTDIPSDLVDPLQQTWQVAWEGHALLHEPAHIFDSNAFWPHPWSAAFSDALLGYTPAAIIGSGTTAALVRYDLLFLLAYALAFAGAYFLARELGVGPISAAVAGAAFAYAPWRLYQNGHLNVLSSGGIPLALFLLLRGYKRRRGGLVFAGWAVAAWQLSLGFTLGIQLAYVLLVIGAGVAVMWFVRGRPRVSRGIVIASAVGIFVFVAWAAFQALPYFEVIKHYPEVKDTRTVAWTTLFSPPPRGYLAVPESDIVWGHFTAAARGGLNWAVEETLFPGLTILVLAIAGLFARIYAARTRFLLLLGVVVTGILAMGFRFASGRVGYAFLYAHAPGWQASRTPGRLTTLTTLALALLGAAGAEAIVRSVRSRGAGIWARVSALLGIALAVLVLFEGAGAVAHPAVPDAPSAQLGLAGPQLHLPMDVTSDSVYMYWSIDGYPNLVNGSLSFIPDAVNQLGAQVQNFPDSATVAMLQSMGVRTVVLHLDRIAGTPWQDAPDRTIAGLPVTERRAGSVIIYTLATR